MMKKTIIFVMTLMSVVSAVAQTDEPRNEIGISYGVGVSLIGDGIGNSIGAGIFDSMLGRKWTNDKQFGTLAIEYFRHLDNPKVAFGAILTYAQYSNDLESNDQKVGERTRKYITVMPAFKYMYVNKPSFGLYSKLGLGLMFMNLKEKDTQSGSKSESKSKLYLGYQVSLLGLEAGSQHVRAFVEAGFGEQGIVLAGLKYRF